MQTIKPNQGVMWKFHQIVEPLFVRVLANELESTTLASIRDALLPKLLSGEVRVKDAERFAEEVM
jgi:type I restriction enzyme S subunit